MIQSLCLPLEFAYRGAISLRRRLYRSGALARRRLRTPVVSVGNLVLGGTGKTPLVAWLAGRLRGRGLEVTILSRGYRRASRGLVVVSDGREVRASVAAAGDEPLALARECPGVAVVVGTDRAAAGAWAEDHIPSDVFLLDDGFQHLRLERSLDLLVLDASSDHERLHLLPGGPLREPLQAMGRADLVLVSRAHRERSPAVIDALVRRFNPRAPLLRMRPRFTGLRAPGGAALPLGPLSGARVVALSALGRPEQFEADLRDLGAEVVSCLRFRDHHRYRARDLERIASELRRTDAAFIVTTCKDLVRLEPLGNRLTGLPLFALRMSLEIDRPDVIDDLLLGATPAPAAVGLRA